MKHTKFIIPIALLVLAFSISGCQTDSSLDEQDTPLEENLTLDEQDTPLEENLTLDEQDTPLEENLTLDEQDTPLEENVDVTLLSDDLKIMDLFHFSLNDKTFKMEDIPKVKEVIDLGFKFNTPNDEIIVVRAHNNSLSSVMINDSNEYISISGCNSTDEDTIMEEADLYSIHVSTGSWEVPDLYIGDMLKITLGETTVEEFDSVFLDVVTAYDSTNCNTREAVLDNNKKSKFTFVDGVLAKIDISYM